MIERFDTLPSSQDLLHQRAAAGAPAGTVIVAAAQSSGRGTQGRAWFSGVGGLWLSYLARPDWTALPPLSLRVGLELAETLSEVVGVRIAVKWPNDLLLAGGKLGGVLTEARWQGGRLGWLVLGVGLNVRNELPTLAGQSASRLADFLPDLTPGHVEGRVIAAIERALEVADVELSEAELTRFAARDGLLCQPVDGTDGVGAGLAANGQLQVRRPSGEVIRLHSPVRHEDLAASPTPA